MSENSKCLSVECPKCGATIGRNCATGYVGYPHERRKLAWREHCAALAKVTVPDRGKLTPEERAALTCSAELWNLAMPLLTVKDDFDDLRRSIHEIQRIIMSLPTLRTIDDED